MPVDAWDTSTELGRLYAALKARTQIEAADMLGVRQSALSDCKRRGNIVTGNLLEKAVAIGISPVWIKDGKLPIQKRESCSTKKCSAGRYCLETCPALEAIELARRLAAQCAYICKSCEHHQP